MSRDTRSTALRYGHREKLSSRGVVPDVLTNLPSPVKRRASQGSTKKSTEKKKIDGITFVNIESAASEEKGKMPTTQEIVSYRLRFST